MGQARASSGTGSAEVYLVPGPDLVQDLDPDVAYQEVCFHEAEVDLLSGRVETGEVREIARYVRTITFI
jgi:hypothetical protein